MGREPVDIHMDKKSNGVMLNSNGSSNDNKVHISPKTTEDNIEADEVKECTEQNSVLDDTHEKQEVLGVKSTNFEGKNEKPASQKSTDAKKLNPPSFKSHGSANTTVPRPFTLATEKRASSTARPVGGETVNSSGSNANSSNSPTASKGSQPNSPLTARKSDNKKHLDEEDNWSVASSSAASVRTVKSKVTVGVAPTFRSTKRLERRKEFYHKLEEKHQALEAEKRESEQRLKEEQEAAIRQLRKSMAYKANPVPSFYFEGPPPKVELKKLPLTRPKSPNLNRRKSCSDATNPEEKGKHCARHRHSIDCCKEECKGTKSPRFKGQVSSPRTPKIGKDQIKNSNGRPKSVKSAPGKITTKRKETQAKSVEQITNSASGKNTDDMGEGVSEEIAEEEKGADAEISLVVS